MAEVKGLAIHSGRSQKQGGDKAEPEATATVIREGCKVEPVVSPDRWKAWFDNEARIIELTPARSTTIKLAPPIAQMSVLNNSWMGISVLIAEGEEKNNIKPQITTFQSAVERLKQMTNSSVTPMIIHPDGRHEEGYYLFDNEEFSGLIFIDKESVVSPEAVADLSTNELANLSQMKMEFKQGQIGGPNDGGELTAAEVANLSKLKMAHEQGLVGGAADGNGRLTFNEEATLQTVRDRYQAGEIEGDDQPTELMAADIVGEEVKEVKELVSFEEIEAFQSRAQGRFTLTAIVFAKQPKLETPVQNQSNVQTNAFVNNTVPMGATQDRPKEGSAVASFNGTNPFFAIRPGDIKS